MSAAASIAIHLSQRGFTVRLVTAEGEDPNTLWHDRASSQNTAPLLEALAVVTAAKRRTLETDWLSEGGHTGLLVAVFGDLGAHDRPVLSRIQHHGATPLALALDVDAWIGPVDTEVDVSAATLLTSLGWRAVGARPTDRLPTLWQELGRRAGGFSDPRSDHPVALTPGMVHG